jgi:hypothetical protein
LHCLEQFDGGFYQSFGGVKSLSADTLRKPSGTSAESPEATLPSAQDEVIVALRYACETATLIIKFSASPQRR